MAYNSNRVTVSALDRPAECMGCPLDRRSEGFAVPEGTGNNGVILVGEKLGQHEVEHGTPMHPSGQAGAILERSFKLEGLNRHSFKLINAIQCMPPYGTDVGNEWAALEHCAVHRNKTLLNFPESGPGYKRKVILAMGEVATRTLTGLSGKFDMLRGYPEETPFGLVLPTYNPAKLIAGREAKLVGVFRKDLLKAVDLAKYGWVAPSVNYTTHPSVAEGWAFYERAKKHNGILTFDIENDWPAAPDNLLSVQFSIGRNEGIFFPGTPEYLPIIRSLLALPIEKWSYNGWKHDSKLLLKYDCPIDGFHGDAFWLFHHVEPDLTTEDTEEGTGLSSRQGLQYAASLHGYWRRWKHLVKSDPRIYGIVDVDCLQYMVPSLKRQAMKEGLWESFMRHVVRYYPILDDVTRRGIPVNEVTRLKVAGELIEDLKIAEAEIQEAYPDELKNIHPKEGFVREPKWDDKDYRLVDQKAEWFDSDSNEWRPMERRAFKGVKVKVKTPCNCFVIQEANAKGKAYKKPRKVYDKGCTKCNGKKSISSVQTEAERWVCLLPFKPSKDQIVRYMNYKKHKVPHKKGPRGGAETTEFKELVSLAEKTKDTLYTKIVNKRKLEKLKSTYIDGWKPNEKTGCVHAEFLMSTASGQLASVGPNALNPPKHNKKLAEKFRSMIEAPDDRIWVEMDFKSYHGATLAAESGDEVYYKVAVQAGDAHSFLASHLVGKPIDSSLPLDELTRQLKAMRAEYPLLRDTTAKQANLGYGFGMQGPGLYGRYPEYFEPRKCQLHPNGKQPCGHACEVIGTLDKLYPGNCAWRLAQATEAAKEEKLISKYGHVRRFYSVYTWRQMINQEGVAEWVRRSGDDMEDVFAYRPSNHAHCNFREVQIKLDDLGVLEENWFALPYHDAIYGLPRRKNVDKFIETCYSVMHQPIKRLAHPVLCPDGLVVGVDVKIGKTWATMEDYKI